MRIRLSPLTFLDLGGKVEKFKVIEDLIALHNLIFAPQSMGVCIIISHNVDLKIIACEVNMFLFHLMYICINTLLLQISDFSSPLGHRMGDGYRKDHRYDTVRKK